MVNAQAPQSPRRLVRHRYIRGTITCLSGLHIGAGRDDIEIGGNDNPIIRDPVSGLPYIPGSSLKGRMRALLELRDGHYNTSNGPSNGEPGGCAQPTCAICRVFGPHRKPQHGLGPSRILVRDALADEQGKELLASVRDERDTDTEFKSENMVRRTTGIAEHPRTMERVPVGTTFSFEIALRIFNDDDEDAIVRTVEDGLRLVADDALGAGGSRGSGRVRFDYRA